MASSSISSARGRSVGRGLDSSLENYQQLLASAGEFMSDEIEKLPLRKYDRWLHPEAINPLILLFRDKTWEGPYTKEPDPLFRFYLHILI